MDTIVKQRAEAWLTGSYDEETKAQVKALTENNPKELEEPGVRHRRTARYHGRGHQSHEQIHRWDGHTGISQLPKKEFPFAAGN